MPHLFNLICNIFTLNFINNFFLFYFKFFKNGVKIDFLKIQKFLEDTLPGPGHARPKGFGSRAGRAEFLMTWTDPGRKKRLESSFD